MRIEILPPGSVHFGKEFCRDCDKVLRFLPKPETVERQKLNGFRLARLGMCGRLTNWERNFVRDVLRRRKLSPKQQAIVDRLVATYLEGGAR